MHQGLVICALREKKIQISSLYTVEGIDEDVRTWILVDYLCYFSLQTSLCPMHSVTCLRATNAGLGSAGCWSGLNVRKLSTGTTSFLHPIAAHRYLWCADSQRARKERRKRATLREGQCTTARERERDREKEGIVSSAPLRTIMCMPALYRTFWTICWTRTAFAYNCPGRCNMCKYALYCCSLTVGTSGSASLVLDHLI